MPMTSVLRDQFGYKVVTECLNAIALSIDVCVCVYVCV